MKLLIIQHLSPIHLSKYSPQLPIHTFSALYSHFPSTYTFIQALSCFNQLQKTNKSITSNVKLISQNICRVIFNNEFLVLAWRFAL
jgi:hypothetical protein